MTKRERIERYKIVSPLAANGVPFEAIDTLLRQAKSYHTWTERLCNDTEVDENGKAWRHNPYNGTRHKTPNRGAGLERSFADFAKRYGVTITTQGDPRGCVVRLTLPDGREFGLG